MQSLQAAPTIVLFSAVLSVCFYLIIAGSNNVGTVPIKAVAGPQEEEEGVIPYTEIDIDLPDVKKECLEQCERITQTAGNTQL